MSSQSTRRQQENSTANTYQQSPQDQQHEQHQATIRSIDETKNNIQQATQELKNETPRYSQAITDFQNQTVDATQEIANTFLDSQRELINSFQSAWAPVAQRTPTNIMGATPYFSPQQIADVYARAIGAFTEAYVASTRMATNGLFAGLEATRATTNYTRQNAKEASRITSNTARAFGQTTRETVEVQGEGQQHMEGGSRVGAGSSSFGTTGGVGGAETRTGYATEGGTTTSGAGTGTTTTKTVNLSDTEPGVTEKDRKKS